MKLQDGDIIGIGDSWEDYPLFLGTGGGLLRHLGGFLGVSINNLAKAGDSSLQTMGLKKSQVVEQVLARAKICIVSSGGDDIAGDQFCIWLNQNSHTGISDAVNWKRLDAAIDLILADYEDLLSIRDRVAPNCLIVSHSYDFPVAEKMGVGVLWLGPWLKPGFDYCGWVNVNDQVAITRQILFHFNERLKALAAQYPDTWIHCDTQGTLGPDDWQNEIHPNAQGFQKIAQVINAKLIPWIQRQP